MDMVGIDYIGPISPIAAKSGAQFICIVVDNHTKWMSGSPIVEANSANTEEFFLNDVVKVSLLCSSESWAILTI